MPASRQSQAFDVVVIGGGSAGYAAARAAVSAGATVAVVEGGNAIGGLCILRGCMPSKTLLESAHRWHAIREAAKFGLEVRAVRPHLDQIIARKKKLIGEFAAYRRNQLLHGKFTFLRGKASFVDPHTLLVKNGRSETSVTAKAFVLATGSRISDVNIPGLKELGYLTSDTALNLTRQPKSLIVLGGGVIAVELGQFYARIGTKVTLIQRSPHIVKDNDEEVSAELEAALRDDGMELFTGTKLISAARKGRLKTATFEHSGKTKTAAAEEILFALGRVPAVDGLNLPALGADILQAGRVRVDDALSTVLPHVFAAGDVTGLYEVVHIAIQQAEVAGYNAALLAKELTSPLRRIDYRLHSAVTFTDPEIASVGLTARAAAAEGIEFVEASYPFNDHGKSIVMGVKHGFVKLIAETQRGEILGATIIGPHASDLIHELIAVMHYHGTAAELAAMPHYHPTLAEIVTYPAEEIVDKLTSSQQ
jgi:pyruvate/2-oxoglutarate dehydrogenase complex dihydrolipoamide dehydrogenase (E3) component